MKRKLLLLFFVLGCFTASAQPTHSQVSGNAPTEEYDGYVYNFSGDEHYNCFNAGVNLNYNQFNVPGITVSLNSTYGYLHIDFDGTQDNIMANHLTTDNCMLIENFTSTISIPNPEDQFILLKVRSSADIETFGVVAGYQGNGGYYMFGDGPGNTSTSLTANEWTIVRLPLVNTGSNGDTYDFNKILGWGLYVLNDDLPAVASIDIDYVRMGSAVRLVNSAGTANVNGDPFVFDFTNDSLYTCLSGINTSGNSNFFFSVDPVNQYGVLTQLDNSASDDIFVMSFTDPACYLNGIDLSDPADRFVTLDLMSDIGVNSFAVVAMANSTITDTPIYGEPATTYSLNPGEWTTITFELTDMGGFMDFSNVLGIAIILNPSAEARTASAENKLSIETIRVGAGSVTTSTRSSYQNALKVYPNPSASGTVNYTLSATDEEYILSLTDMTGKVILLQNQNGNEGRLDLSSLTKGIYILKITNGDAVYTEKVVVQ